jgi:hypothetical protein
LYGEGLLAPRPTPKLENRPLSIVRGCLFNVFAGNLRSWRLSLYPRPEDAPCRGDRGPPNMATKWLFWKIPNASQNELALLDRSLEALSGTLNTYCKCTAVQFMQSPKSKTKPKIEIQKD